MGVLSLLPFTSLAVKSLISLMTSFCSHMAKPSSSVKLLQPMSISQLLVSHVHHCETQQTISCGL
jgi:hypothetical protein